MKTPIHSEITITLKMEGGTRNCAKVRKILIQRICEVFESPLHYIGKDQVTYDWELSINSGNQVVMETE